MAVEASESEKQFDSLRHPKPPSAIVRLIEIRRTLKAKKPAFRRQESWRYKRVRPSWRRPKGIDSKMRLKLQGRPKSVEAGYRSPRRVRGLDSLGCNEVVVSNVTQLNEVSPDKVVRIDGRVGKRKRLAILEKSRELKLYVINPGKVSEVES
ncbi:MAG: 50S ribosomal protein L32e [Candidatus Bathyarchaeia archaeon]